MSEWQPIGTAPSHRHVLIASRTVVCSAVFESDGFGGGGWDVHEDYDDWFSNNPPTHWMPLPDPPRGDLSFEGSTITPALDAAIQDEIEHGPKDIMK